MRIIICFHIFNNYLRNCQFSELLCTFFHPYPISLNCYCEFPLNELFFLVIWRDVVYGNEGSQIFVGYCSI